MAKRFLDGEEKCELSENFVFMEVESMILWLPKFVLEVHRRDGAHYPPDTLYAICTGLSHSLKGADRAAINIFTDPDFMSFKETLDSKMKQLSIFIFTLIAPHGTAAD